MEDDKRISIEIRGDGVYLVLNNKLSENKPTRGEALKVIEDYGVLDIDFTAVNEAFTSADDIAIKKISSNVNVQREPERVEVTVSKDQLEAFVKFIPPVNHGEKATFDGIKKAIEAAGVKFGVLEEELANLAENRVPGAPYLVAKGVAPKEGKDGYITMNFDTSAKSRKPKELEGGRVDYRSLNLIDMTSAGGLLVTAYEAVEGTDGTNVLGNVIPAKKVKPAPPLPQGKNTSPDGTGLRLIADINGQIAYDGKRVNVLPVLDLPGNVDNATGDIYFNGAVVVRGNVVTGFNVSADGDIEVFGVVEGATLISKENITVKSGVQGQEKATLTATGNITVRYAESCTLNAGKDIFADSIMHSLVKCGGNLELKGRKGLLVGGRITVGNDIDATTIGSTMATVTELEAGFNPEIITEYKLLLAEYESIKVEYDKMSVIVTSLTEQNKKQPFTEEKKKILLKTVHTKMYLREKLLASQAKIDKIAPLLMKSNGKISASEVIRSGVKVSIGNAVMYVRDDIPSPTLTNIDSKIHIGAYEGFM